MGTQYSIKKQQLFAQILAGGCWVDLDKNLVKDYMKKAWYSPEGKRGILRRLSLAEPSLTILTSLQMKQT
ncbi:Cytosine-specific DNA methyltransferase/Type II site-specific deoxyribonuclease [Mesomycoplasma conjunctivae]|uniref:HYPOTHETICAL Modification methylase Sau96I n=1 Tax=Mesomycoplasma conjunctivae (strain ATCC 25834 / NCTC 10147 / HRC/581) TaxID=572263 RepID=C5J5T0_MESCH|nr:hypothetical protein [Mesomycoplasma conjunctivae]CAT04819.1 HYPOTHETICAL Modification methylase Sau96I [Mesomycoplasma conjunctivae]VEU65853.1 Cytosine-specific DNA methyltransferase/Type II site-specific deoxyribonuclease [Mesomycoplasma conjunctivae]